MNDAERDALWMCAHCGTRYCIPDLARRCEAKHEEPNSFSGA